MGKKWTEMNFFPMTDDWGWSEKDLKDQWAEFKDNMDKLWDLFLDMHKTARKARKDQWGDFFTQFQEMQQTFADAIPEDAPRLPMMPTPKEFMEKVKEFQETANNHAMEQSDNRFNFNMDRMQKAKEVVTGAVKNIEDTIDNKEAAQEKGDKSSVKPAAKSATKPAAKKPAAKSAAKPADKSAAKPAAKSASKPAAKKPAAKKPAAKKPAAKKPAAKPEAKPEVKPEVIPEVKPEGTPEQN